MKRTFVILSLASLWDFSAQAKEHEGMVAAYKANSRLSNDKNRASTISPCEYFVSLQRF